MFDVTVVGSANVDLVVGTDRIPQPGETVLGGSVREFPGGKGLNQAVAAARMGAHVAFVGAVGTDAAGDRLVEVAAGEGIDVSELVRVDGAPTGRAMITVDADGQNSIVVVPGANGLVDGAGLPPSRVVVAQLEIPLAAVRRAFAAARAAGATTVLDPAPATPLPDELLALTDVIVPNEHEAAALGGPRALRERGVGVVVVTKGGAGVEVVDGAGSWTAPAPAVEAVDTTGAGDAFCGTLAARLASGAELPEAIRWATAAGAHAATVDGAVPSLPTVSDVERLLGG